VRRRYGDTDHSERSEREAATSAVIAVGSGTLKDAGTRVPLDVKAGDVILFGNYTSQEIKRDGEEYLIMPEDEALVVVETG
jgi:chaperonin GroES